MLAYYIILYIIYQPGTFDAWRHATNVGSQSERDVQLLSQLWSKVGKSLAKTQSLSKVQLGHPSLVDHNSQECPRQQVQQQGNEGESLRLKEITSYHFDIFRNQLFITSIFSGPWRSGRPKEQKRSKGRTDIAQQKRSETSLHPTKIQKYKYKNTNKNIKIQIQKYGHRAAKKVRNKFVLNWNMVMADIYPRKAEYQRISFITYTANYQTLGWHRSHQIHPLKRWFRLRVKC